MTYLLVLIGGAVGAPIRFLLGQLLTRLLGTGYPWGTLTANALGSAILGAIVGANLDNPLHDLLGTGLCGALTTFSTFENETVQMLDNRAYLKAGMNAAANLLLGLLVASACYALAHAAT